MPQMDLLAFSVTPRCPSYLIEAFPRGSRGVEGPTVALVAQGKI